MPNDKPFYLCWVDHQHKVNEDNRLAFNGNVPTVRHYSLEEAKAEAERLCKKHGHPVYPLRADGCYRPVKPCPVEWVGLNNCNNEGVELREVKRFRDNPQGVTLRSTCYMVFVDGVKDMETWDGEEAYARYRELGGHD
jgi:hypothetical protein